MKLFIFLSLLLSTSVYGCTNPSADKGLVENRAVEINPNIVPEIDETTLSESESIPSEKEKTVVVKKTIRNIFQFNANDNGKRALIIANSAYDKVNTGWNPINAKNDVPLMKAALMHQGFAEKNITVLHDGTKQQIMDAFKTLEKSITDQSGDAIVIHFSSHGQQITDDNGDEIDGLDEAIIPVDACVSNKYKNYDGSKHLRDDEIGEALNAIRKRVGPKGNVFLVMDACHSGTSSRGMGTARGTHLIFGAPADGKTTADKSGSFSVGNDANASAPLVAFYGTSADHLNYETIGDNGKAAGSLSYAVSKALVEADEHTSYAALFGMVRNYMARKSVRNVPQMEGNMDQIILGGALLPSATHFNVMQSKPESKLAVINGGQLHGIFKGSKIAFYPPDTRDVSTAKPISTGVVMGATEIISRVQLNDILDKSELDQSWVHVSQYAMNYPDVVSLAFDLSDKTLETRVRALFEGQSVLNFVEPSQPHDLLVEELKDGTGMIQIYTKDDQLIFSESAVKIDESDIHARLLDYVHSQHIRNLEIEDPRLSTSIELIPITIEEDMMGGYSIADRLELNSIQDVAGNIRFKSGDVYRIKITNNSASTVYFTVMDITPTGEKTCLLPDLAMPGDQPVVTEAECQLGPGQSMEFPNEKVSAGYMIDDSPGKETLKLIVTASPWNICETLQLKGAGNRGAGELNPLDVLLDNTFKLDGTRAKPLPAPKGSAAISSFSYTIK